MLNNNLTIKVILSFFTLTFIATLIFYFANVHMDEFIQFFALKYDNDNFNVINFSQGYNAYIKKAPLFKSLIYQPFQYVGSIQSYLFRPFYNNFSIINAKYLYSLISLIIIYTLYFIAFNVDKKKIYLAVTFLPIITVIMHDSGPVNISIIIFFLSKIIVNKIFNNKNVLLNILLFLVLICFYIVGLFDKIFFIYLYPSIFFFSLSGINFWESKKKMIIYITCSLLFLIYSFLFVKSGIYSIDYNQPNLILNKSTIGAPNVALSSGVKYLLEDRIESAIAIIKTFDYPFFLSLNFDLKKYYGISIFGFTPIILIIFFLFQKSKIKKFAFTNFLNINVILFLASLCSMIFMFLLFGGIRLPHHTIFIYLPLIGILTELDLKFSPYNNLLKFHLFSIFSFFLIMFVSKPESRISEKYNDIHEVILRKTNTYKNVVINFSGWNYYYIESLNRDNLKKYVTYVKPSSKFEYQRLLKFVKGKNAVLINVFSNLDNDSIEMKNEINYISKDFNKSSLIYNSNFNPIYLYENK
jgi:hypothetical protein